MGARLLKLVGFSLVGLVAAIVVLVAAELVLRVLGVGAGVPRRDPFAGFSRTVPLFEPSKGPNGVPVYRISWARGVAAAGRPLDEPQREFRAEKQPGTFRVFVIGDSSAAGVPYGTNFAFSTWLAQRLATDLPNVRTEVVNAAIPGYATRRLITVTEELLQYAPDLIITYVGHNEYAERRYYEHLMDLDPRLFRLRELLVGTRVWGLLSRFAPQQQTREAGVPRIDVEGGRESKEMFAVLDTRAGGKGYATAREREYGQIMYRSNLERIVETAKAGGVRIMLLSQSQNFSDWAPGASAHRPDLAPADLSRWEKLVDEGNQRAQQKDCATALARYGDALKIDDQYADLHYRIATCERSLGRFDDAWKSYRRASDLDQVPHGSPTGFNTIVREVAAQHGALFADAAGLLEQHSEHGFVGDDLFCDWVHPNIRGHQVIAAAVAEQLKRAGVPVAADQWASAYQDPDLAKVYADHPELRLRELVMYMGTCLLAHRADCSLSGVEAIIAADPDNPSWKKVREDVHKRVASWTQ